MPLIPDAGGIRTATARLIHFAQHPMLIPMVMHQSQAAAPTATILIGLSTQADTQPRAAALASLAFAKLPASILRA